MVHPLPHEIILEILSRLTFEYVIQCKEVCKTWRNLLRHIKRDKNKNLLFKGKHDHDHFTQLYHGEYDEKSNKKLDEQLSYTALTPLGCPYIFYIDSFMVCSHRGLVFFHKTSSTVNDPIYICNPFAQETVIVPQLALPRDAKNDLLVSGFGYLYATNEYKIVRIYYEFDIRFIQGQVYVYTLGDKCGWRNKGMTDHYLSESNGILSNGAIHWIANLGLEIVAFDLADEEFRSVPTPPCLSDKYSYSQLQLLGGYLSIVVREFSRGSNTDIWLFKGTKNEMHWCKEFTIRSKEFYPPYYHPFALTEENKILMWLDEYTLCYYDPKTATFEGEFTDKRFKKPMVIPYMKSDVSLSLLVADLPVVNWARMNSS